MKILKTSVQDHYIAFHSTGFIGILKGVEGNYVTSIRMMINLAHADDCLQEFTDELKECLVESMHPAMISGMSLRELCEYYEYTNVNDFTENLNGEDYSTFVNTFDLDKFREGASVVFF